MRRRVLLSAIYLCSRGFATNLPSVRLQRLLGLVPESSLTVVDVGCDHGLLARALARTRPRNSVFAVDKSEAALAAAKLAVGGDLLEQPLVAPSGGTVCEADRAPTTPMAHPSFILGDGLRNLASYTASVETVVCAGMGSSTTAQILREGDLLQQLGVQRLVLQPWPSYLLPLSSLLHTAHQLGFTRYEQQFLDSENGIQYITTSLVKDVSGNQQISGEVDFFMRGPLFSSPRRHTDPHLLAYLREQQRDLELRKRATGRSPPPHSERGDVVAAFDLAIARFLGA